MRVALLAPIWERVPPPAYGGIEVVVSLLAEALVERGHEVTLFATGDAQTSARLSFTEAESLRHRDLPAYDSHPRELRHVIACCRRAAEFDVIHNHVGYLALCLAPFLPTPMVTTLHGPFTDHNMPLFNVLCDQSYVSISLAQQAMGPVNMSYAGNVYNGIDTKTYGCSPKAGYLLHLGRLSPEKGSHIAVQVARAAGIPLILAGKVDAVDRLYFEREVAPWIDGSQIRYIGEVGGQPKVDLLGGALALLHPVQWPEPFGLVLVEAMAAGTPVIAFPQGSIPEIVEPGLTGAIVKTADEMIAAIPVVARLSPAGCRRRAIERFDVATMTERYEKIYETLAAAATSVALTRPEEGSTTRRTRGTLFGEFVE